MFPRRQRRETPRSGNLQRLGRRLSYAAQSRPHTGHLGAALPGLTETIMESDYGIALDSHSLDEGALESERPFE